MKIYHGTSERDLPFLDDIKKRFDLDFGNGVYFTSNIEQAKEWSCRHQNKGAVYEYEIDLSTLKELKLSVDEDDYYYLCYLCKINLEFIAKEAIDNFEDADVVYGRMIKNVGKFKYKAEEFNEGNIKLEEFKNITKIHNDKDQFCFKNKKAINLANEGIKKIYYTERENGKIVIKNEKSITYDKKQGKYNYIK